MITIATGGCAWLIIQKIKGIMFNKNLARIIPLIQRVIRGYLIFSCKTSRINNPCVRMVSSFRKCTNSTPLKFSNEGSSNGGYSVAAIDDMTAVNPNKAK